MTETIPAATVVVVTDGDEGLETLMLRKTSGQSFGGMWVFPGGRVEPGDDGPASTAVREATEETGLLLTADDLVPYARWTPPEQADRRYDTWFFLVGLPPGADEVVVDGGEIGEHVWTTPQAAFERHAAGEIVLAPPTWMTLHRLAQQRDVAGAFADARAEPVNHYETHIRFEDKRLFAVWAPDAAYEGADLDAPGPRHRLLMTQEGSWTLDRS